MNSFIDAGYHWIETTTPLDQANHERRFQRGLPAPVTQVEAGRVHALAARFDTVAERFGPDDVRYAAWRNAAVLARELLK